jgi:HK97 family phage portal protein
MAESPIAVQFKDSTPTEQHDMAVLLRNPNPYYSGRALRKAMSLSYVLDGNAYLIKIRNKQLKPIELWYVPHWMITPHWPTDESAFIDYYSYTPTGKTIELAPMDVVHFRDGIDPKNTRKGLSPLQSLFREVVTDDEAANYTAVMLKNSGVPSVIISPNDDGVDIDDEDAKVMKREFREKFTGDRRGGAMVLTRRAKVDTFGWSPKELDLGVLRDIPEERVSAVLGLPAAVAGFGTGLQQTKVGATMVEMRQMAYDDCILPMQQMHADDWKGQLLADFEENIDDWKVVYDNSNVRVLQEDDNKRAERSVRLWQGGLISREEGRLMVNLESEPADDVMLLTMGGMLIPRDATPEDLEPEPTPESEPMDEETEGEETEGEEETEEEPETAEPKSFKASKNYSKYAHALMLDWLKLTEFFASQLRERFRLMGKTAYEISLKVFESRGIERFMVQPPRKGTEEDALAAAILSGIPAEPLKYGPHYVLVVRRAIALVEKHLGIEVNLSGAGEARIIGRGGTRRGLLDLDQQTKDAVYKALAEAREQGLSVDQAAQRIATLVEGGPWQSAETRAYVIARTETKYAQNAGSLDAYATSTGITGSMIFDAQLGPTDAECEARNGRIVTFRVAEAMLNNEHPNGTISIAPYVGELPSDADDENRLITF